MADIIVISILCIIVFFIVRSYVKKLKNKTPGCGCGCSGCNMGCDHLDSTK